MNLGDKLIRYTLLGRASELADELDVDVYIVGGFIRDLILGRKNEDIDFLIVGDVIRFAQSLANSGFRIKEIVIYKNFGTAHFNYEGLNLEFVAARKESYNKVEQKT